MGPKHPLRESIRCEPECKPPEHALAPRHCAARDCGREGFVGGLARLADAGTETGPTTMKTVVTYS